MPENEKQGLPPQDKEMTELETTEQPFEGPPPATLLDKAIAFAVLAFPVSYLLDLVQQLIEDWAPRQVVSIVLLVGIVGFLFLVGWAARRVRDIRKKF